MIKASEVSGLYPGSAHRKGGQVMLRNSEGIYRPVPANTPVYHRGKGRFAAYNMERDRKVIAKKNNTDPQHVGGGAYIHAGDGRRIAEKGKKKSSGTKSSAKRSSSKKTSKKRTK
jgi:hypothetical protein